MRSPDMRPKLAFFTVGVVFALTGCPKDSEAAEDAAEKTEQTSDRTQQPRER